MANRDAKRLFDISTRHQLYVEGVKVGMFRELQETLAHLSKELSVIFDRLKFSSLGRMTQTELNKLLISIRKMQRRVFTPYASRLMKQIEQFMIADLSLNKRIYATEEGPFGDNADEEDANSFFAMYWKIHTGAPIVGLAMIVDPAKLWASVKKQPMPANGVSVAAFVKSFDASAQGGIEKMVRQAWANGVDVKELAAAVIGAVEDAPKNSISVLNSGSPLLRRILNQGKAVIQTVVQHVTASVTSAVSSAFYRQYVWNSVIDSSTTDICRARNQKIFVYGSGPVPPAHIRCRSIITPLPNNVQPYGKANLKEWLAGQPEIVQKDLGEGYSDGAYVATPLTFAQYERKLKNILAR